MRYCLKLLLSSAKIQKTFFYYSLLSEYLRFFMLILDDYGLSLGYDKRQNLIFPEMFGCVIKYMYLCKRTPKQLSGGGGATFVGE